MISRAVMAWPFFEANAAAAPANNGAGRDQPVRPQPSGQDPDHRGEDSTVGPVGPRPETGAAQRGDLVPQHEQFRVHGR
jgi:hypothetical protein